MNTHCHSLTRYEQIDWSRRGPVFWPSFKLSPGQRRFTSELWASSHSEFQIKIQLEFGIWRLIYSPQLFAAFQFYAPSARLSPPRSSSSLSLVVWVDFQFIRWFVCAQWQSESQLFCLGVLSKCPLRECSEFLLPTPTAPLSAFRPLSQHCCLCGHCFCCKVNASVSAWRDYLVLLLSSHSPGTRGSPFLQCPHAIPFTFSFLLWDSAVSSCPRPRGSRRRRPHRAHRAHRVHRLHSLHRRRRCRRHHHHHGRRRLWRRLAI